MSNLTSFNPQRKRKIDLITTSNLTKGLEGFFFSHLKCEPPLEDIIPCIWQEKFFSMRPMSVVYQLMDEIRYLSHAQDSSPFSLRAHSLVKRLSIPKNMRPVGERVAEIQREHLKYKTPRDGLVWWERKYWCGRALATRIQDANIIEMITNHIDFLYSPALDTNQTWLALGCEACVLKIWGEDCFQIFQNLFGKTHKLANLMYSMSQMLDLRGELDKGVCMAYDQGSHEESKLLKAGNIDSVTHIFYDNPSATKSMPCNKILVQSIQKVNKGDCFTLKDEDYTRQFVQRARAFVNYIETYKNSLYALSGTRYISCVGLCDSLRKYKKCLSKTEESLYKLRAQA